MKTYSGIPFLFSETGTEGGIWSVQEDGFLADDGIHWSYYGLRSLKEGDDLTIFDKNGNILYHGIIKFDKITNLEMHMVFRKGRWVQDPLWTQQVVDGMWVHWLQSGISPEAWSLLFNDENRATVITAD